MGNAASCVPTVMRSGAVKVLSPDGRLEAYRRAVKAAELMTENPGQFVCESSNLKVGYRIEGLSAEEVLERRQFYFLLPMDLLYSVLTHEELSFLNYKASRAMRQGISSLNNLGKIVPAFSEFCLFPSEMKTLDCQIPVASCINPHPADMYSKQRSWKPALETIEEIL